MKRRRVSSGRSTKSKRPTTTPGKAAFKSAAKRKSVRMLGKQVSHRNIDTDGVTYSFLSEFLTDREAARMTYVEGYQESGMIGPIEFGHCFHNCLEETARNHNVPPPASKVINKYIIEREKQSKLKAAEKQDLQLLGQIVAMMFPIYHDFWKQNKGIEFSPEAHYVAQEEKFEVAHTFPFPVITEGVNISTIPATINLRGRFDAIFRSKGKLWLMENKTKSQIDSEGLTASLTMDLQTMLYCQAIKLKYGEAPAGVLYNVIKRPGQRFGVKDTQQSFLQRIQDAVLANPSDYFMRWHVDINESELEEWVSRSLNPILIQVKRWWDSIKTDPFNPWHSPEHFVNPEALYTRYGRSKYFDYYTRKSKYGLRRTTRPK